MQKLSRERENCLAPSDLPGNAELQLGSVSPKQNLLLANNANGLELK
jgi:hypothetical protein